MDEIKYLDDPRGGRVPLTDAYGNLTVDAMVLYSKDLLSKEGKAMIDQILANDEMARDAVEGYTLMANAKEAKAAVAAINNSLGAEKEAVVTPVIKLDYKRFSVAAAILLLIGISGFLGVKFIGQNQLADNIAGTQTEVSKKRIRSGQTKYDAKEGIEEFDTADELIENENSARSISEGTIEKTNGQSNSELKQIGQKEETPSTSTKNDNSSSDISNANREKNKEDKTKKREELLGKLANLREQKSVLTGGYDKLNETKSLETVSGHTPLIEEEITAAPAQKPSPIEQEMADSESDQLPAEQERLQSSRMVDERGAQKAKRANENAYSSAADIHQMEEVTESVPVDQVVYGAEQVDQLPRFPGGDLAMFKYIEKKKIHPPNLEAQSVEGEVFVSFQLDGNGNVTNVKSLRADNAQMEADAIRVIKSMPRWQAAKKGGYPVTVKKTVLIKYRIKD